MIQHYSIIIYVYTTYIIIRNEMCPIQKPERNKSFLFPADRSACLHLPSGTTR